MILLLLALLAQSADPMADGNRALDAKEYDRALALFIQAAAADAKDFAAEFQIGLTYSMMGRDDNAIPHYKAALALNPELYEAQLNLGLSLLRAKDAAAAIPYLETAAAKRDAPLVQTALARAMSAAGRLTEAETHYRMAAALDPAKKEDLLELAAVYEQAKQYPQAIAIYREFPAVPNAQERLRVLLGSTGQTEDSIPALEAAVQRSPTDANRVALAQAYAKANQTVKASAMAGLAVASQPRDWELRLFYGRLLRDQRKLADAATQFAAAAQIKPDSVEAWNELAAALTIGEQYTQALAALDRVRALGAETPGNLFFRALAHDHLTQRPEAIEAYNKFLAGSQGKFPDQEFQARQRVRILEKEVKKR